MLTSLMATASSSAQATIPFLAIIIFLVITIGVVALVLFFVFTENPCDNKDEKYYLEQIARYTRIIAKIMVASIVIAVMCVILLFIF